MIEPTKSLQLGPPHKWTTQGGHWQPASAMTATRTVVRVSHRRPRRLGLVDTASVERAAGGTTSAELRNLRPRRERGVRGFFRRLMGVH